ncbi:hypothetical protein HKM25_910 [Streptococcus pneumoniae]|nr:hypothetical protein SPAR52_0985 [Streptococcus pneumoniae GA17971]EJG34353.1 hypothetical protein AMCSP03_001057 [Streptococcus pneumoniae 2070035]KGI30151.1 hypothetical protein BM51_1859 [Streptococcus pneumoniae]QJS36619.1 hypothetical protein HKM25_910 [Streptococcus pneumoniae]
MLKIIVVTNDKNAVTSFIQYSSNQSIPTKPEETTPEMIIVAILNHRI